MLSYLACQISYIASRSRHMSPPGKIILRHLQCSCRFNLNLSQLYFILFLNASRSSGGRGIPRNCGPERSGKPHHKKCKTVPYTHAERLKWQLATGLWQRIERNLHKMSKTSKCSASLQIYSNPVINPWRFQFTHSMFCRKMQEVIRRISQKVSVPIVQCRYSIM